MLETSRKFLKSNWWSIFGLFIVLALCSVPYLLMNQVEVISIRIPLGGLVVAALGATLQIYTIRFIATLWIEERGRLQ